MGVGVGGTETQTDRQTDRDSERRKFLSLPWRR